MFFAFIVVNYYCSVLSDCPGKTWFAQH